MILLGEREDKALVKIMIIIFGILCIITAGWWAVFLVKYPGNENIFWLASIFLFLFGIYQLYSGLGYARRFISRRNGILYIRQNSLLPGREINSGRVSQLEVRSMDMVFHFDNSSRFRVKLGIRYPDLGQKIKSFIIEFAEDNNIDIFYKNEPL